MNELEIKKEYSNFLNDTKRKGTKADKNIFKNKCIKWCFDCFGLHNEKTLTTIEKLNKF